MGRHRSRCLPIMSVCQRFCAKAKDKMPKRSYFGCSKSTFFRKLKKNLQNDEDLEENEANATLPSCSSLVPIEESICPSNSDSSLIEIENEVDESECSYAENDSFCENDSDCEAPLSTDDEFELQNDDNAQTESDIIDESQEADNCSSENSPKGRNLRMALTKLVLDFSPTSEFCRSMLKIFREHGHPEIPATKETLLGTPRSKIQLREVPPGHYYHFGIEESLLNFPDNSYPSTVETICLDIGVDGLPLVANGKLCMWPILAAFTDQKDIAPFVVGAYVGYGKPDSSEDFMKDFIAEVNHLYRRNGVFVTKKRIFKKFKIVKYICDSPARSFITNVLGHTASAGCPKCDQRGKKLGPCVGDNVVKKGVSKKKKKLVFKSTSGALRTDASFTTRKDPGHHKSMSAIGVENIKGIRMVSDFVLDPMHIIDLGVVRRILKYIFRNECSGFKLTDERMEVISSFYTALKPFIPSDFVRKPRSFTQELTHFKATEYRLFGCYTGLLVFRKYLPWDYYVHFLHLYTAIRLLSAENPPQGHISVAEKLLQTFVDQYHQFYGANSVHFNVHALLHISDCVRLFGNFSCFSAFKFENALQHIKKLIKRKSKILEQLYNRIWEERKFAETSPPDTKLSNRIKSKYYGCGMAFKSCQYNKFSFNINDSDSFAMIHGNIPVRIVEFQKEDENIVVVARRYIDPEPIDGFPINSLEVGVMKVNRMSEESEVFSLKDITCKCMRLPFDDSFLLITVLHLNLGIDEKLLN
uniref:Transposase domain-containing protein n=2 Tax=Lutzomyia longipalpis TaxID=7200 RepID=A0A1B0CQG4_LUTLO